MKTSEILAPVDKTLLTALLRKSDGLAFIILATNYLLIAASFFAVIRTPHALTWILASAVLAGRQLGLAILMHDCAHNALFASPWLNRIIGRWLCAAPVMADLDRYRTYHLEHHRSAGSKADPDRPNYEGYPVSGSSLRRKFTRDLMGITGLKLTLIILKMNAGTVAYQLSYDQSKTKPKLSLPLQLGNIARGLYPTLLVHLALFGTLWAFGAPWAYLLWWVAWLTFYMAFSRLRNAAEHGATVDTNDLNPLKNTRTTMASWWERLFVAPNYVNYHLEHHLLPTVPPYHLPRFHQLLKAQGVLNGSKVAQGYGEVLRDLRNKG